MDGVSIETGNRYRARQKKLSEIKSRLMAEERQKENQKNQRKETGWVATFGFINDIKKSMMKERVRKGENSK